MRIVSMVNGEDGHKALRLPMLLDEVCEEYQIAILGNTEVDDATNEPMLIVLDVPDIHEREATNALNILFGEPVEHSEIEHDVIGKVLRRLAERILGEESEDD